MTSLKVAVIGGTGCGGRAAVAALLAGGHRVTAIHRGVTGAPPRGAIDRRLDRRDVPALARTLAEAAPSMVIDHVAYTPEEVRDALSALPDGVRRYVLISSASSCGPARAEPWAEDDAPQPVSPHGERKLKAEAAARRWAGGQAVVVRLAGLYGSGHDPLTVLGRERALADHLRAGTPIPVPDDPSVRVQPWDADDHGRLMAALVADPRPPALLHAGSDEHLGWEDLLSAWAAAAHAPPPVLQRRSLDELEAEAPERLRPFLADLLRPPRLATDRLRARYPSLWPLTTFAEGARRALAGG